MQENAAYRPQNECLRKLTGENLGMCIKKL